MKADRLVVSAAFLLIPKQPALTLSSDMAGTQQQLSNQTNIKPMKHKSFSIARALTLAAFGAAAIGAYAQKSSGDFVTEPDKDMAAAHESLIKGDTKKASMELSKAANYVKTHSDKAADASKADFTKAGDELDKLSDGVKNGTVKSADALKKSYAKVDLQISKGWHATAAEAQKSGKDSTAALKQAGLGLENAGKWSGHQFDAGTQKSLDALKKAGQSTKEGAVTSTKKIDEWFKSVGDGIDSLSHKL